MKGLCTQLSRIQVVHAVIHLATECCHTIMAQFQGLAFVCNRGIGISRVAISNIHRVPLRPGKAVRCIIAAIQRFIAGISMLHCQPAADAETAAQRQRAAVVQLTIQRITIAHQGVVPCQRGGHRTAADTQRSAGNRAGQRAAGQVDAARRSGHFRICGHRQSTTRLRNRHSSIIPLIDGFLVDGRSCSAIIPGQQVFAPGDAAACGGVAVAAQQQIDATVLHCCSTCNIKCAAVENLHRMRFSFQEAAGAAVVVHINAGGIRCVQLQGRSIETAAHYHIPAHIQDCTHQVVLTSDTAARDGSCSQRAFLQSQVCVGQGTIQHTAIQHHGSTRSGNGLAHRIYGQRTLLHGDACERIACIGYNVAHAGTVSAAVEQVVRVIYLPAAAGGTVSSQHQLSGGSTVCYGHAAVYGAARPARQLHAFQCRLAEPARAAVAVHIYMCSVFRIQGECICLDAASEHQRAVVDNHAAEGVVAARQRVAAAQGGCHRTAADTQCGAGNRAGQRAAGQVDATRRSGHFRISGHRQCTTCLRNRHSSIIPLIDGFLVDGRSCSAIIPGQQVFAPGDAAACGGVAVAAQQQIDATVLHCCSTCNIKCAAVENLHRMRFSFQEAAGAAVVVHINAGGICADQMQQRSIETAAHANGAADTQNRTKSIINTDYCTVRDGSRAQRAVLQSQGCVGQGAIQHTAIQHHGSTRSGNRFAHRIHSQRTLLHGDACERIACIRNDFADTGAVSAAVEQVVRVIYLPAAAGGTVSSQHQLSGGSTVCYGHAAIYRGAGTTGQLHRHQRRLRETTGSAVTVHIHESRQSFLNQRKGICLDIAAEHQRAVVRNHCIQREIADTFQRIAAVESSRNATTRSLDVHAAHAAAQANLAAICQQNNTIFCRKKSPGIGIHREHAALHLDACQLCSGCILDSLHICHSGAGQQVFIMVNHTTADSAAIAAQNQGVCCGIMADFSARIHRGTAVDNLHPFECILRKTAGTAVAIHVHTGGSFCVQCPRGMNLAADTQRATVADSPTE